MKQSYFLSHIDFMIINITCNLEVDPKLCRQAPFVSYAWKTNIRYVYNTIKTTLNIYLLELLLEFPFILVDFAHIEPDELDDPALVSMNS